MENVLYGQTMLNMIDTYVIDGKRVKNRNGNLDLTVHEILDKVVNYENIAIQREDNVHIYCDNETYKTLKNTLYDKNLCIGKAYHEEKVKFFRKYDLI